MTQDVKTVKAAVEAEDLRSLIAALPQVGDIVDVPAGKLGTLRVKVIDTGAMIGTFGLDKRDHRLAVLHASIMDAKGQPFFKSIEEVRSQIWPVSSKMLEAIDKVNDLDLEAARGN